MGSDGSNSSAALLNVNGTFYGTTQNGGTNALGTAFRITTGGAEKVLHNFGNGTDGYLPAAGLTDLTCCGGTVYGTTVDGGTKAVGTVFSITTSGTAKVLFSFDFDNGAFPPAGLLNVGGTLYGTTAAVSGYTGYDGKVFRITTGGAEKVLYSFKGAPDGYEPEAGLVNVNGTLYGTTYGGGTHTVGTVFSITTSGTEKVLHSFKGDPDGKYPEANLINVNGTLYGTTYGGGTHNRGTIFSITTIGTEKVLHSFDGTDGSGPAAALRNAGGTLYGTTANGGAYGYGVVFSVSTTGSETVLHSFGNGSDGRNPYAPVIDAYGTLYGTTYKGGTLGDGTVFALTP